jgi:glycosyltransferase involved in cell wall biosynthesis
MAATPETHPRVLHGITHLGLGGAERVAMTLIRALRDRFEFGLLAVRGVEASDVGVAMSAELRAAGITVHTGTRAPIKGGGLVLAGWRAAQAVARFQPDLVHLHTEIPEASYAVATLLRPSLRRVPVVRTIHNAVYWAYWPRLGRWCERRLRAGPIAAVSEDAREAFERFHRSARGHGPIDDVVVIPNGVAIPPAGGVRPARVDATWRLLFGGRFEPQKGTDLIPEAIAHIALPVGTRAELVLHGSGAHEPLLRELAAQPPPGWTVRVEPPCAEFAARIPAFDLVLMPSRFEGLGLVAIEAVLSGVPVIATDAPGLRGALPADYPWRARAGDAASFAATLQRAFAERDRWPAVLAEAQAFARARFSVEAMATNYAGLYARALS